MADAKRGCWIPGVPELGLGGQCAVLAGVTALATIGVAITAGMIAGPQGVRGAVLAGLLCLGSSELALALTQLGRKGDPGGALTGMLLGMICRLGMPLAGSLAIRLWAPELMAAGALQSLIVLYLVTLAVEVSLELCNISLPRYRAKRTT